MQVLVQFWSFPYAIQGAKEGFNETDCFIGKDDGKRENKY